MDMAQRLTHKELKAGVSRFEPARSQRCVVVSTRELTRGVGMEDLFQGLTYPFP